MARKKMTLSRLEGILAFAMRESIEFAKQSKENFSFEVEKKIERRYRLPHLLAVRINTPVYWRFALGDDPLIPVNHSITYTITEKALKMSDREFKPLIDEVIKKHRAYFIANFENFGYKNPLSK